MLCSQVTSHRKNAKKDEKDALWKNQSRKANQIQHHNQCEVICAFHHNLMCMDDMFQWISLSDKQNIFPHVFTYNDAFYLAREHKVGVHGHGCAVSDEVGDRLHDIPGVLPPGEPRQDAELGGHVCHASPQHPGGTSLCLLTQLLFHLRRRREVGRLRYYL